MLINGDCLEEMNKLIEQGIKVDAIITDPPYGVNFNKIKGDKKELVLSNIPKIFERFNFLLNDGGYIYMFVGVKNIENWIIEGKKYFEFKNIIATRSYNNGSKTPNNNFGFQFQPILLFSKGKGKPLNNVDFIPTSDSRYKDKRNKNPKKFTYEYPNFIGTKLSFATEKRAKKNFHPTEKSMKLSKFFIETVTNKGEVVLDPFMGGGTTGVACKNIGRGFIGIELDKEYFEIAKERILPL